MIEHRVLSLLCHNHLSYLSYIRAKKSHRSLKTHSYVEIFFDESKDFFIFLIYWEFVALTTFKVIFQILSVR